MSEVLHGDLPGPAAGRGLRLLRVHADRPAHDPGVLRVKIVGFDAEQRRRLAEILAGAPGVEVTGGHGQVAVLAPMPPIGEPEKPRPTLSPRQRDVLVAYASGNELLPVVARRLGMDEETLKTHLRRLRAKYRSAGRAAPTRRDLYVRAVEDGLIPPPS